MRPALAVAQSGNKESRNVLLFEMLGPLGAIHGGANSMRNLLCLCLLVGATITAGAIVRKSSFCAPADDDQAPRRGDVAAVRAEQPSAPEGASSAAGTVNLGLDEESAENIAEIVLIKVYGRGVLRERPWNVETTDTSFKFTGRLPSGYVGGVAEIEISKRAAAVTSIIHTK
jgi:hypothetical protein